jgi:hypothetical protein
MSRTSFSRLAAVAVTSLGLLGLAAPAEAVELRAAAKLSRKVTYSAIQQSAITATRIGRIVEGKITFAASLGGSPTGTAAQACARVEARASKYVPPTGDGLFGVTELVKAVAATPVDANDLTKGCKYSLSGLPHSIDLSLDASYNPPTAWNPACNGNIAQISTNKVMTVKLPNSNVKVSLDQTLDYKYCGNLN